MAGLTQILIAKIEELLGDRGKKANRAVRFRDLSGDADASKAIVRVAGSANEIPPRVQRGLDEVMEEAAAARERAEEAADDAQEANVAAGNAQDFANAEIQKALRNLGQQYEIMESGFALSSQAQGRDRVCLNDTFLLSSDWGRFGSEGTMTSLQNEIFPIGRTLQFEVTAAQQDGLQVIDSPETIWTGPQNAAAYVVEVVYTLVSGTLPGAGVRLAWRNTGDTDFAVNMRLSDMQAGGEMSGSARLVRGLFVKPPTFAGTFAAHRLFAFANWSGIPAMAAKNIKFHRINVRLASAAEIESGMPMPGVQAFIAQNYMTAAAVDTAIANTDMTLQASLAGTMASVLQSSTALASLNGSVARFRNIVTVNGEQRAGIEAVAFSGTGTGTGSVLKLIGDDVIAEGTLSAGRVVVHDGSGNLFPDPQFGLLSLTGWTGFPAAADVRAMLKADIPGATVRDASPAGTVLYFGNHAASGNINMLGPSFQVDPNTKFNLAFDYGISGGLSAVHTIYFRLQWLNADGGTISSAGHIIDNAPATFQRYSVDITAPAGTVRARIQVASIAAGMTAWSCATNFTIIRKRTGVTLIEPNSVTTDLVNTDSFYAAGLAVFGGNLQSANFNGSTGTGWRLNQDGTLVVPDASISNAKIGNVIQSNDFVSGDGGSGWRINKGGIAEFNAVKIRRQIAVASGTLNVGGFTPQTAAPGGGLLSGTAVTLTNGPGRVETILTTSVPITAWQGAEKTYIASAGMSGSVSAPLPPNVYWGWTVDVLPLTRWEGNQSLRLKFSFWSLGVSSVNECVISWKIYEVS